MVRLRLNTKKPNNYAFFCPISRLHLTMSNPSGLTDGITPAILRGLKTGVLLDLDGVVDIATGNIAKQEEEPKNANNAGSEVSDDTDEDKEEVNKEEPKKKPASRRKTNKEKETE